MSASAASTGRGTIAARLRARRPELEQAVLTRVYSISDPTDVSDPTYAEGLRATVAAALDYGLDGLERGERSAPDVPPALLLQARLAARSGVSLDTVLRRYFAGYALLGDFLVEEDEEDGLLDGNTLKSLLRTQAALFDRLLAAVSEEYARETDNRLGTSEERRAERVQRLLAGEALDTTDLDYDFDGHHIAAIASGPEAPEALRRLASSLDCRLLLVRRDEEAVWAWLGARRKLDPAEVERLASRGWSTQMPLAIGECSDGLAGWRLSHRQAAAALPVAQRGHQFVLRYAEVALLASILQDDLLATSLRRLYLEPLESERDGGEALRQTLRAYFAAQRNISSAASSLEVTRKTITARIHTVERLIDRPLERCGAELEVALRLDQLNRV